MEKNKCGRAWKKLIIILASTKKLLEIKTIQNFYYKLVMT